MSNTRHATPGSALNQNRFASSPDIERGLLGNLVALKCATVESAEDRELLYWLQHISRAQGGLARVAGEVIKRFLLRDPDAVSKMKHLTDTSLDEIDEELRCNRGAEDEEPRSVRERHWLWQDFVQHFPEKLAELCLDPAVAWPAQYPELYSILRELKSEQSQRVESAFAHTELSRIVWRELAETHEMGGTVLLHNSSGNGKSYAAKTYCETHPGHARYVNTPATNDETGFLRAIAEALGVGAGLSFKAIQMRERILPMLRARDIVLVLDSAQWLFPVSDYRYALPNRINWILTALSEQGVPVVMIAESKLFDTLGLAEARTGWNRNKFVNQLSGIVELPAALEKEDVQAVAAALLPDGERAAQRKLADFMIVAQGYLHAGQPAAQRSRRIAASHQRERVTLADMTEAIDTRMVPAFKSMNAALKRADDAAAKCKGKVRNWRPDTAAQTSAKAGKRRNQVVTSSDLKPAPQIGSQDREQPGRRQSAALLPESGSAAATQEFSHPRAMRRVGNDLKNTERLDAVPA